MPRKNILLLDAVLNNFTIVMGSALPDSSIVQMEYRASTSNADHVIQLIHQGLEQLQWSISHLTHCMVNVGPGRFTNIRTVQVIAQALAANSKMHFITVSTLELVRYLIPEPTFVLLVPVSSTMGLYLLHNQNNDEISKIQSQTLTELQTLIVNSQDKLHIWYIAPWSLLTTMPDLANANILKPIHEQPKSWELIMTGLLQNHSSENHLTTEGSIYGKTLHLQQLSGKQTWL